jgi:hypothetical protein
VQDREQAPDAEPAVVGGKLLYTVEQWRAFEKRRKRALVHRKIADGVLAAARRTS